MTGSTPFGTGAGTQVFGSYVPTKDGRGLTFVPGDQSGLSEGSGGIRDFGAGAPTVLHGREAVMTQDQIERLIEAAASGGGNGGDVILHLDGEEVGRVMMDRIRGTARGRGY